MEALNTTYSHSKGIKPEYDSTTDFQENKTGEQVEMH